MIGAGTDLGSIPGVGRVAVRVDDVDVDVHLGPRRRVRPAIAGLAALILLPAAYAGTLGQREGAEAVPDETVVRSLEAPAAAADAAAVAAATTAVEVPPVFATFDGLPLHLPDADTVLVGFHEAAYDDALQLTPQGTVSTNENTTKFSPPPPDTVGPRYVVLSSRGRATPASSAVDMVMRDDVDVRSVVSGVVTEVRPYALYGRYPDTRIEIEPTARPDLRVVLIHVDGVQVAAGDEVVAGETVLATTANRFPFSSHIDRYTEPDRWPHVHLELKRVTGGAEPPR